MTVIGVDIIPEQILYGRLCPRTPDEAILIHPCFDDTRLMELAIAELSAVPVEQRNLLSIRKAGEYLRRMQRDKESAFPGGRYKASGRWLQWVTFPIMSPGHHGSWLSFPSSYSRSLQNCNKCGKEDLREEYSIWFREGGLCLDCVFADDPDKATILRDAEMTRRWLSERYSDG